MKSRRSYPSCKQKSSAIGRSIVCEAYRDPVLWQLVGISSTHDLVSFDLCIGDLTEHTQQSVGFSSIQPLGVTRVAFTDLAADVSVGEPDNHPILRCVVLVLVLHNQALPGIEVGFTL